MFVSLFFSLSLLTITSCKKSNVDIEENTSAVSITKFLTAPPNTDPAVLKVIEKIKTMETEHAFLGKFIEQNGYAYWDKAMVQNPVQNVTTSNDAIYVTIPMAAQNTEIVNSLIVAKLNNNSVEVKHTKEQDYAQMPLEKDALSSQMSKEDFATLFFYFSKEVFDKKDFKINDPLMFQTDSSLAGLALASAEQKEPVYVSLRGSNSGPSSQTGVSTCITMRIFLIYYAFSYFPNLNTTILDILQLPQNQFICQLNNEMPDRFPLLVQIDPPPPTSGPSAPPVPVAPWILAGFALENKNPIDNNESDEINNVAGGFDNTVYPIYTGANFPTVSNILPVNSLNGVNYEFKGWGQNGIQRYSLNYNKAQIAQKNQQISNYNDAGQTYKIYDETTGVNAAATNDAISYITGALQAGIPVIVGVDCRPGTSIGSQDNTTDHFVTIVGMGNDISGNFFRYYDCSTYSISQGTRSSNKLYLSNITGILSGSSPTLYAHSAGFTPYKITQVRRSKPL